MIPKRNPPLMRVSKINLFQVPKESTGKSLIHELTSPLDLWNNNSPYRNVALKMFMLLPNLVLHRTSQRSKTNDNNNSLERRFAH